MKSLAPRYSDEVFSHRCLQGRVKPKLDFGVLEYLNELCRINDSYTIDHMKIRDAVHQLKPIERFECDWWWSCRDLRLVGPVSAGLEIIITTCYWLRGSAVCSLNGGIQLKWIRTQKVYRSGILRPSHHQFPHITHRQYFNQIKSQRILTHLKLLSLLAILFDIFR